VSAYRRRRRAPKLELRDRKYTQALGGDETAKDFIALTLRNETDRNQAENVEILVSGDGLLELPRSG